MRRVQIRAWSSVNVYMPDDVRFSFVCGAKSVMVTGFTVEDPGLARTQKKTPANGWVPENLTSKAIEAIMEEYKHWRFIAVIVPTGVKPR